MEKMMLDKITDAEYDMMHRYRDWYAWQDGMASGCKPITIRELLELEWAKAKQNLFKLFGNELILTKEFNFEKSISELEGEVCQLLDGCGDYGRVERNPDIFYDNYRNWVREAFPVKYAYTFWEEEINEDDEDENTKNRQMQNYLTSLCSVITLAENEYTGPVFHIPLRDGKCYTVHTGCKPMKALSKIAASYGIEGFEDFRICHSQIHNQKKIRGDLTISIHPFDYWTMSDNTCDWDSCMSWMNNGGYRTGTVEMMNSPVVVVAYIAAKNNMPIGKNDWNNKKWRQLFVVSKDAILGIKDYPYHNNNISNCVACWLRDLARENMGWEYTQENPVDWNKQNSFPNPEQEGQMFSVHFHTNRMYNDVGANDYSPLFVGVDAVPNHGGSGHSWLRIGYSGANQCVSCGVIDRYNCVGADDSCVCCNNCEDICCCPECGERIYEDDRYYYNGKYYCSDCYWDFMCRCDACEEEVPNDETRYISFFVRGHDPIVAGERATVLNLYSEKFFCDRCFSTLNEDYLKPGKSYFEYKNNYGGNCFGVFVEDLNEDGKCLLGYRLLETLREHERSHADLLTIMKPRGDFNTIHIIAHNCDDVEVA